MNTDFQSTIDKSQLSDDVKREFYSQESDNMFEKLQSEAESHKLSASSAVAKVGLDKWEEHDPGIEDVHHEVLKAPSPLKPVLSEDWHKLADKFKEKKGESLSYVPIIYDSPTFTGGTQVTGVDIASTALGHKATVTGHYGDTREYRHGVHKGTDFSATTGNPLYASFNGTITRSVNALDGNNGGLRIQLESSDSSVRVYYMHLSRNFVTLGQRVRKGELIGYTGGSAAYSMTAFTPHLHMEIEVKRNGSWVQVDPEKFIAGHQGDYTPVKSEYVTSNKKFNLRGISYSYQRELIKHNPMNVLGYGYEGQVPNAANERFASFSDPYYSIKAATSNPKQCFNWETSRFTLKNLQTNNRGDNWPPRYGKKAPKDGKNVYHIMCHYCPFSSRERTNNPLSYSQKLVSLDPGAFPYGIDTPIESLGSNKRQFVAIVKGILLQEQGVSVADWYLGRCFDAIFQGGVPPTQENLKQEGYTVEGVKSTNISVEVPPLIRRQEDSHNYQPYNWQQNDQRFYVH